MAISRLIVEKFRNLNAVDLEFDHGFNFLVGNNGSGKTSLLEASFLSRALVALSKVRSQIASFLTTKPHFTLFGQIQESQHQWSVWLTKTPPRQYHRKNKR